MYTSNLGYGYWCKINSRPVNQLHYTCIILDTCIIGDEEAAEEEGSPGNAPPARISIQVN